MGFSKQGYWSGLPCPPPGDLHDPGLEPVSLALASGSFTWEALLLFEVTPFVVVTAGPGNA